MNWDDLRVFTAVARKGRLDLAARVVEMNASSVSRRMTRLEAQLGARLFEQSGTGRVLTESGRKLLEMAEQAEHAVMHATSEATGHARPVSGHVRINVSEGWGAWVAPRHIGKLRATHPELVIDIIASDRSLDPRQREADVTVTVNPTNDPRLYCDLLTHYDAYLYASRSYVDVNGLPRTIDSLVDHRMVGFIPEYMVFSSQDLRQVLAPSIKEAFRVTSINTLASLVSAGLCIGVLPRFIACQIEHLVPVLPHEFHLNPTFWIIASADALDVPRIDAVVHWLREVAAAGVDHFLGPANPTHAPGPVE